MLKWHFAAFVEAEHFCPAVLDRRSVRLAAAGGQECPRSVYFALLIEPAFGKRRPLMCFDVAYPASIEFRGLAPEGARLIRFFIRLRLLLKLTPFHVDFSGGSVVQVLVDFASSFDCIELFATHVLRISGLR